MKKMLMLGSSKGSKEIVLEAKNKGYYTIVTDYLSPQKSSAKQIADEYWMLSTGDIDQLEIACKVNNIDGITNGISGFNVSVTMELAKRLQKPCYSTPDAMKYARNKREFKDACRRNGVPVAKDFFVSDEPTEAELDAIEYPVVVKPTDQSTNRGMSYCFCSEEIIPALRKAKSVSESKTIVIEKMMRGHEYAAWYALADGKASLINFSKMYHKEGYPSNCYSITTTYTDNLEKYLEEIDSYIKKAFLDIGCREGIAWIEMMLDEDDHFYVLEMGYRLSGDMMALVHKNVSNFNSYAWLLDIAMGVKHTKEELPDSQKKLPDRVGCSYILWSKEAGTITKWSGFEKIPETNNINIETTLSVGSQVNKHQYLAVITFDAADFTEMCDIITQINNCVEIWNEDENIVIYYDDLQTLKI